MNFHNFILQFAVLIAPFIHQPTEQVTATLSRGCDPKVKDIYALHDEGFKTIVSLRLHPEKKKEKLCKKLDMQWIQIPTGVFLAPSNDQFDQFRSIINNPKNQPCYVCCEVGMDRVGVYIAAYRMVDQHWTLDKVEAEFKQHHQKVWWPAFRKYKTAIANYAEEHNDKKI